MLQILATFITNSTLSARGHTLLYFRYVISGNPVAEISRKHNERFDKRPLKKRTLRDAVLNRIARFSNLPSKRNLLFDQQRRKVFRFRNHIISCPKSAPENVIVDIFRSQPRHCRPCSPYHCVLVRSFGALIIQLSTRSNALVYAGVLCIPFVLHVAYDNNGYCLLLVTSH